MDCSPPGFSVRGDFPGKNTRVGCHALLQRIFPAQGSNPGLPRCRQILYHLSHQGSPLIRREMKNLRDGSGALSPTRPAVNDLPSPHPHSPSTQPPSLALPEEAPLGTPPPISDSPPAPSSPVIPQFLPLPHGCLPHLLQVFPQYSHCPARFSALFTPFPVHLSPFLNFITYLFTADPTRQEPW